MKSGYDPRDVEAEARSVTRLDSFDIGIVSGHPRVMVRFTAVDDGEAQKVHQRVVRSVSEVVEVLRVELARIVRGRDQILG